MKQALTIAGSDSSAGAGIQADLKTFAAHGVYGMSVLTAVTAQNTCGVSHVHEVPPETITRQMEALFSDIPVHGVKIGMVPNRGAMDAIAGQLKRFSPPHVVLDTPMVSTSGYPLLAPQAMAQLMTVLFPLAGLVTPNIPEAERISGNTIRSVRDMESAARKIHGIGSQAVLIKAGHAPFEPIDVLFDGAHIYRFPGKRIHGPPPHGTGCTLSAAITANLASGAELREAVAMAKRYVTGCIVHSMSIGRGMGFLDHFHARPQ